MGHLYHVSVVWINHCGRTFGSEKTLARAVGSQSTDLYKWLIIRDPDVNGYSTPTMAEQCYKFRLENFLIMPLTQMFDLCIL